MTSLRAEPLIREDQLRERVDQLAERIVADLGTETPLVLAGLLRGCYVFMADLARALCRHGADIEAQDFIVCSSYGDGMTSARKLDFRMDLRTDIAGKRVLIVDDIIDTGHTLLAITEHLQAQGPEMVRSVVLLDKPERRETRVEADYVGFTIENLFVVGYGLDFAQRYRDLPYVTVVEEGE